MVRFGLSTRLRESNLTQLAWDQIDMDKQCAFIHTNQAKTGKAIPVPLNEDALEVIRAQVGKNEKFVFTYKGNPDTRANNKAWRKALKRTGIENFRWHDLRHCFAMLHAFNGTSLHVLQELLTRPINTLSFDKMHAWNHRK